MRPRRVGGFRPFARAGAIASIGLIGMVFSANAVFAASPVIGAAVGNTTCPAGFDTVQISPAYAVPVGGGSISSWTTQSGPLAGIVGLEVWTPTSTTGTYQLVQVSPLVTPLANSLMTFPLTPPIPVNEGDLLGLRIESNAYCFQYTAGGTDTYGGHLGATPAVGGTAIFGSNAGSLDVEATVDAAVITPPPPPPPTGCDSTGTFASDATAIPASDSTAASAGDSTATSAGDSTDTSNGDSTATSAGDSTGTSNGNSTDRSTKDSTDKSTKDSSDQSKKDKSAKDQSTGGDNCQQ